MRDDYAFMLGVVAHARGVQPGVDEMFAYAARVQRDPLWRKLKRLDFAADARAIERGLRRSLAAVKIPARYRGYYCGLDCLNIGNGVELGLSTTWSEGLELDDTEWATDCDLYPERLGSDVHDRLLDTDDELADLLFRVGFLGLALRRAFSRLDRKLLLGGAKSRGVCWGHHDGDLWDLGTIRPDGFHPRGRHLPPPLPPRVRKPRTPVTLAGLARELITGAPRDVQAELEDWTDAIAPWGTAPSLDAWNSRSAEGRAIAAWRAGNRARYRAARGALLAHAPVDPKSLRQGRLVMKRLAELQGLFAALGDHEPSAYEAARSLVDRTYERGAPDWVMVARYAELAVIADLAGLGGQSREAGRRAEAHALMVGPDYEQPVSPWLQVMCCQLDDLDGALVHAERTSGSIPPLLLRLRSLAQRHGLQATPVPALVRALVDGAGPQ